MLAEKVKKPLDTVKPEVPRQGWKVVVLKSNKLHIYFNENPELEQGLKSFVAEKIKAVKSAFRSNLAIVPQNIKAGWDRGMFTGKYLRGYYHYHINATNLKLYVLVYKQEIDQQSKTVKLYLSCIIDHKQYESSVLLRSVDKALSQNVTYTQVGVVESKKLFEWLGPIPTRKLFDWLKGKE